MEGADKSTEQWRHPMVLFCLFVLFSNRFTGIGKNVGIHHRDSSFDRRSREEAR